MIHIFLPISLIYVLGAQKNRLIETVLLSTHNIYFGWEIRKLNFHYTLLTKGMWQHGENYDRNMSYAQKTAAYILQCSVHHSYFGRGFVKNLFLFITWRPI